MDKNVYYIMHNVGKAKYCLFFHTIGKTHKDGSAFFDLAIFKNKKKLAAAVRNLEKEGYTYGTLSQIINL